MGSNSKEDSIFLTENVEVMKRKADIAIPLTKREWDKIKSSVNQFSSGTKWWELGFSSILSIAITLWITVRTLGKSATNFQWFLTGAVATTLGTVITLVAMIQFRSKDGNTKKNILDDIKYIEGRYDIESSGDNSVDVKKEMQNDEMLVGQSFTQGSAANGIQYVPINIPSGLLSNIVITLKSKSPFWRVGLKLIQPNASSENSRLGENTALFHLSNTNGEISLDIYPNGLAESHFHKKLPGVEHNKKMTLTIDRNKNNYVSVYVNDVVEYNDRFDSELFKKAAFLSWGDGKKYEVSIMRLEYTYS